jgi:hypothetical protein
MDVVRDVLDQAVVDRDGRAMGRVDGLLLKVSPRCPPTLTAILIGPSVLGDRIHPLLGRLVRAAEQLFGLVGRPTQIGFGHVIGIDREITVDMSISDTSVDAVERGLRTVVSRIPGAE